MTARDLLTGGAELAIEADLVVLAAGLTAREDTDPIAKILKLSKSSDRFLMEAHPKLRPVESLAPGFYLAGAGQGPKDIPDAVAQASGAAASAQGQSAVAVLRLSGPQAASIYATLLQVGAFVTKVVFFCWVFIWVRWTLPRFRYDQLMALGWRVLLPLALAQGHSRVTLRGGSPSMR